MNIENKETLRKVERTVNAKLIFLFHLIPYVIINSFLIVINLITSPQYLWFKWPLLGWGVGLIFHAVILYVFYGETSLKERMIKKEMEKHIKEIGE